MADLKKICVIGLGYIGLPTAAMFASRKIEVVGVDVSQSTIDTINRGEVHISEPDLDMVVNSVVREGYLRATNVPEPADAFLIAVQTPFKGESHDPDLGYIEAAARSIAPVLETGNLVILESTSPVGTTEAMAGWLAEARPDLSFPQTAGEGSDIRVAYCPERVLPGKLIRELVTNDRVIGGMTPACSARAIALYKNFVTGDCVNASGPRSAEMTKLAENSFRDINIAFANELSLICHRLDIDVWELIALANRHPRVNILQPGPGVGGHCIAVDPWFVVSSARDETRLIKAARNVNDSKPDWLLGRVEATVRELFDDTMGRSPKDVTIACYGLTYKADTDDLRESPALAIVEKLVSRHPGKIFVIEPTVDTLPKTIGQADLTTFEAAAAADIHLMLVDHSCFQAQPRPGGHVIDARGIWSRT